MLSCLQFWLLPLRDERVVVFSESYIAATFDMYAGLLSLYWRVELRGDIERQLVNICSIDSGLRVLKIGAF